MNLSNTLAGVFEPKQQIEKNRQRFSNRDLFRLILPILVEQLLTMLVGIADTLMVSYAGDAAVSGVSLVNQLNNIFIFIFGAVASGGAVVASQYMGRRDQENGVGAASQLVLLTALISLVSMAGAVFFRTQLLGLLFGWVEADVMDACVTYLVISAAAVVMLTLAFRQDQTLYLRFRQVFAWDGKMVKRILNIALPSSVENGLFQLSKVALSSIVALFGTVEIAANGVAQSFWSMASLFCIAFGYAFVTVIGQCMGAGDVEAADYYNKKLLKHLSF